MSDKSNYSPERSYDGGFTLAEMAVTLGLIGLIFIPVSVSMFYFYTNVANTHLQTQLAIESQAGLRSVVEQLRVSSAVRANNTLTDTNAPGGTWTTNSTTPVLVIATPALDASNNYIVSGSTGLPYQNEVVFYMNAGKLYRRVIANGSAPNNVAKTSCPPASATASCPADALLASNVSGFTFTMFAVSGATTTIPANARSLYLTLSVQRVQFGETNSYTNSIRMTLRNS